METLDKEFFEVKDYTNYSEASKGKRLANFFIDIISFYILIFLLSFMLGIFELLLKVDLISWMTNINSLLDRLITALLLVIYLSLMETIFKGRTLGKLITKTKAVNEDGSIMDTKEATIRNLCRLIPFDILSFVLSDRGWHDSVSHTMVIDLTEPVIHEIISHETENNITQ